MDSYNQLHQYLLSAIEDIRQKFAIANMGHFRLDIVCEGRTHGKNETSVMYELNEYYSTNSPKGVRLQPVIDEAIRRSTWDKINSLEALPAPEVKDDIPF